MRAGHAAPFLVRRRLKWLLTPVDSKLTAGLPVPHAIITQSTAQSTDHIVVLVIRRGSISGLNCENHKEDVIKQKCLGAHAERWMLNRGGRALLR